jgi:NADH-quinone oxidoreductase subunit I
MGYWRDLWLHTRTIATGLRITFSYLRRPEEIVTVQYPHEMDVVPERHRGLHTLETDVCILCDQCSRICPVDCIEIEGTRVKGVEGRPGFYRGDKGSWFTKFTIDYARCIFCDLCIEVCPVDCIHMGKEWDWTGYTRAEMVKNLLTDRIFSKADQALLSSARKTVIELEAKERAEKEAARKKAAAAKAPAAMADAPGPAAAKPAEPGAAPSPKAGEPKGADAPASKEEAP